MAEEALAQALAWVKRDPNEETRAAVQAMVDCKDEAAIMSAFGSRIAFGTAGLRAEMGPGTSRMNDLIIIQTAQGMVKYLIAQLGEETAKERGLVIGFDHRERGSLTSRRFAVLTAAVFQASGFKVYIFGEYVATPFVPFATTRFNAAAGVMVTASHNPAADDGFKVYWGNGCQIIPPHDEGIAAAIEANLEPWAPSVADATLESVRAAGAIDPLEEVAAAYYAQLEASLCRFKSENASSEVKVAYTAMHGIGYPWAVRSFATFGLPPFVPVAAQVEPDATFPTAAFPNPEEKGALDFSIKAADESGCTLILANDPDADRLAVAEKRPDGSGWRVFSGNEIATLLGHWEWTQYQADTAPGADGSAPKRSKATKGAAMVASTVSSKMLRAMGEKDGFLFEDCLTGFKWIGNKALELREEGYDVIFSYEEAIGFCVGDLVADKDGIAAMGVFAEMASQLKAKLGRTCAEHLVELQKTYGYFVANNGYVLSHDTVLNQTVFEGLRNGGEYAKSYANGKYKVKYVRDLLSPGFDSSKPGNKPTLPVSSSSQMITFTFENGTVATLRMSGTEPKLKYYTELSGPDPVQVEKDLAALVDECIKGDMLKALAASK